MRGIQNRPHHLRDRAQIRTLAHIQVHAVDLIPNIAVVVLQAQDGRVQWNVHDVVQILRGHPGNFRLRTELRRGYSYDAKPDFIRLHMFPDRISRTEDTGTRRGTQHADGGSMDVLVIAEEAALEHMQPRNFHIDGVHSEHSGWILL